MSVQRIRVVGSERKLRGRGQNQRRALGDELQFFDLKGNIGLLLGLLAFGNLMTHPAGIFAVERFRDGGGDGFGLEIIRQHRRPRDGLQHGPMPTRRAKQREGEKQMAEPNKHAASLTRLPRFGRKN
jgi:hypothetical protein